MARRTRAEGDQSSGWRSPTGIAAVIGAVVAAGTLGYTILSDDPGPSEQGQNEPAPAQNQGTVQQRGLAEAQGLPAATNKPRISSMQVREDRMSTLVVANGVTYPLDRDEAIYVQVRPAQRRDKWHVSEAVINEKTWQWRASLTVPKLPKYEVFAVVAPTLCRTCGGYRRVLVRKGPKSGLSVSDPRVSGVSGSAP